MSDTTAAECSLLREIIKANASVLEHGVDVEVVSYAAPPFHYVYVVRKTMDYGQGTPTVLFRSQDRMSLLDALKDVVEQTAFLFRPRMEKEIPHYPKGRQSDEEMYVGVHNTITCVARLQEGTYLA